jgi:hypothetical protein
LFAPYVTQVTAIGPLCIVCASKPESVERLPLHARQVTRQTAFALRIIQASVA